MLTFEVSDRVYEAAEEWGERRLEDIDEALSTKVEQSLVEIEHLVSGTHDVEFDVDGRTISYEPTGELSELLSRQAERLDVDRSDVLRSYVDLYANAFLEEATDEIQPPDTPRDD